MEQILYALTQVSCIDDTLTGGTTVFASLSSAQDKMREEYEDALKWMPQEDEFGCEIECDIDDSSASIDLNLDRRINWFIERVTVSK